MLVIYITRTRGEPVPLLVVSSAERTRQKKKVPS
jgi:hypothetical protein